MVRQPDVDVDRAIGQGVVVVGRGAVDERPQRASGRVDHGVLERRRRGAGNQGQQALIIAVAGQRQVLDGRAGEFVAYIGFIGLKQRRVARNRHLLGDGAHLQMNVPARDGVDRYSDIGLVDHAEARRHDFEIVVSRLNAQQRIAALFVGCGSAYYTCVFVRDRHGRFGNDRAGLVLDGTHQGTVEHLSCCRVCRPVPQ